jgi:hypothetical protein
LTNFGARTETFARGEGSHAHDCNCIPYRCR